MDERQIQQVRRFNRTVTQYAGALDESYLRRSRPLGEARVLHEVGPSGTDVLFLREKLNLDSWYLSRMLRSLEAQGLIQTRRQSGDGRARRVKLTAKGRAERAIYDAMSDELAASLLSPLDHSQRDRLIGAMLEVERLLRAGRVEVRVEGPGHAAARLCLEQYFSELSERFEVGFDPANSNSARDEELKPPAGFFAIAWLDGEPAGCGALKISDGAIGEIKRMWTAPSFRGLGIARKVLRWLEAKALEAGLTCLRLETNRVLTEAQALYRREGYREVAPFNTEPYAHHWFEKQL